MSAPAGWHHHRDDAEWIGGELRRLPTPFHRPIGEQYSQLFLSVGRQAANLYLRGLVGAERGTPLSLCASDEDIDRLADLAAKAGCRCGAQPHTDSLSLAARHAAKYGLELPKGKTESGIFARLSCPRWWRRQLRKTHARRVEAIALKANAVNRRHGEYISDTNFERHRARKIRNRGLLTELVAVNEIGESFTVADLADRSVSNPRIRRAELMVRIAGLEKIAEDLEHVGVFYTVTCPSRMHASLSRTGQANPRYDGTQPRDAQRYLSGLWSCIRAKIARDGLTVYGLRVSEPQHDGTPHWHLLVFLPADQRPRLTATIWAYAMASDPDEPGADKHRFREIAIDREKGTAAGYVAKYVSKNIDGYRLAEDADDEAPAKAAERVQAWASLWGIRQFQFFGTPPVTVWRELRRMDPDAESGLIAQAASAADAGDWAMFVNLMGGPARQRKDQPIALWKRESTEKNRYGERKAAYLLGLTCEDQQRWSRVHDWVIKSRCSFSGTASSSSPWSTVNNCTEPRSVGDFWNSRENVPQ